MFSKRTLSQEYAHVITRLLESERIAPFHQPPVNIRDCGLAGATVAHDYFFNDFRWFGALLNQFVSEPWGVEELPDTMVRDPYADGPDLGRRYRVHYNAVEMGTVQATLAGVDWILDPEKFRANPLALVLVDLNWMRFIPYEDAASFLLAVERTIGPWVNDEQSRPRAVAEVNRALTGYLWEAVRYEDMVPRFEWRVTGPYDLLRITTEHWARQGIDPFERWGGDRLGGKH